MEDVVVRIGDVIYSLLKAFADAGVRVGVNWYLTENDGSNDGKFTRYLQDGSLRKLSPDVFDAMSTIVLKPDKSVMDVQNSGVIPDAIFYADLLKPTGSPENRKQKRIAWFQKSLHELSEAELIFMDPDNGLQESNEASKLGAEKYVLPDEVERYFREGCNVVYYCHKGRRTLPQWMSYKSLMFQRIPEAKPAILTYHKGTQRSYVFLIHEADFVCYREMIDSFLVGWSGIFSEEFI